MKKIIIVLLTVVCLGVLPGCRTRYVVRTEEKVKTEYKTKTVRDSVYFSDTVRVLQKGDTVFVEKAKYIQKYKTLTDTVLRVDTVVQIKRELCIGTAYSMWHYANLGYAQHRHTAFYLGAVDSVESKKIFIKAGDSYRLQPFPLRVSRSVGSSVCWSVPSLWLQSR